MELIFDHTMGKQDHQDLVISPAMAIVDPDEEHEALHAAKAKTPSVFLRAMARIGALKIDMLNSFQ